jgi:hypothetical protein
MQLLNDFRKGIIGAIPLELPPSSWNRLFLTQ